ncbi:hypothetical protein [Streptomyces goshikiensis]|uniref:hypothetical protein n=1 Tax=Streptomyces goshikiensis TaxID=1942 RepID=UPI00366900E7
MPAARAAVVKALVLPCHLCPDDDQALADEDTATTPGWAAWFDLAEFRHPRTLALPRAGAASPIARCAAPPDLG